MTKNEKEFAKILDKQNRKWIYPCKTFKLSNTTYRPDFYIPKEDLYIEVKHSSISVERQKKYDEFIKLYPNINFVIIRCSDGKRSITFYLNDENYDKLEKVAKSDRRSKAMITEIAVEQYLNRRKIT